MSRSAGLIELEREMVGFRGAKACEFAALHAIGRDVHLPSRGDAAKPNHRRLEVSGEIVRI